MDGAAGGGGPHGVLDGAGHLRSREEASRWAVPWWAASSQKVRCALVGCQKPEAQPVRPCLLGCGTSLHGHQHTPQPRPHVRLGHHSGGAHGRAPAAAHGRAHGRAAASRHRYAHSSCSSRQQQQHSSTSAAAHQLPHWTLLHEAQLAGAVLQVGAEHLPVAPAAVHRGERLVGGQAPHAVRVQLQGLGGRAGWGRVSRAAVRAMGRE